MPGRSVIPPASEGGRDGARRRISAHAAYLADWARDRGRDGRTLVVSGHADHLADVASVGEASKGIVSGVHGAPAASLERLRVDEPAQPAIDVLHGQGRR
eukprot:scaffold447_cov307-Pinguiococcus_pyrenoidosus.AAC.71